MENVTKGEFNSAMEKIGRDFNSLEHKLDHYRSESSREHKAMESRFDNLESDMKEVLRRLDVKEVRMDKMEARLDQLEDGT